jgi:8-oxo-dGTP pyrophosphatase MutT (NUDIX family)
MFTFIATGQSWLQKSMLRSFYQFGRRGLRPVIFRRSCSYLMQADRPSELDIVDEQVVYRRYATVLLRTVRYPDGRCVTYDIIGQPAVQSASVLVFPFDTRNQACYMIREYCPGPNRVLYGFPAGMVESKHVSMEAAALAELSEEAQLRGGKLIDLTARGAVWPATSLAAQDGRDASGVLHGFAADKYSRNLCKMFLVLDPEHDDQPGAMDAEEWIEQVGAVPVAQLEEWLWSGQMTMPHMLLAMCALSYLRQNGILAASTSESLVSRKRQGNVWKD